MASILVVDDESAITLLVSESLSLLGHAVTTAADGAEALTLAKSSSPDLVITDVRMPNLNGFEVVSHLNRTMPNTKCVLISGHAFMNSQEAKESLNGLRVEGVLPKPFFLWQLVEIVDRILQPPVQAGAAAR